MAVVLIVIGKPELRQGREKMLLAGDLRTLAILVVTSIIGFFLGRKREARGSGWGTTAILTSSGSGILTCISLCTTREPVPPLTFIAFAGSGLIIGFLFPLAILVITEVYINSRDLQ